MKKYLPFLLLVLLIFSLLATNKDIIRRDRASVRTGPGSMYQIVAELANGTEVEIINTSESWLEIKAGDVSGFISAKAVKEKTKQQDIFSLMGTQETDLEVSTHGMSAGVKGFAEKFTTKFDGNPEFIEIYTSYNMDVEKYEQFRKETYQTAKTFFRSFQIPPYEGRQYFTFSEEGMGLGIASRISQIGILDNYELTEYINRIGNLVVEASDAYDVGFKFFILDSDKVNAYACPGGIVFITAGMLRQIFNEAELVGILAHEIAHVSRHHGMQELEERKHHIKADDAFAELDSEMKEIGKVEDEETAAVEAEMEQLAFEIYETIFQGRLASYEEEADYLALIFTARAGYNPINLRNILARLITAGTESTNEHYSQEQLVDRLAKIETNLQRLVLPVYLVNFDTRWQKMIVKLEE